MTPRAKLVLVSAAAGALLGSAGSRVQFAGWLTLIPWGIAGVAVGAAAGAKKDALAGGAAYGAVLPTAFMLAVYGGGWTAAKVGPLLLLCLALSAVGVGCGCILALVGRSLRRRRPASEKKEKPA